jgi:hypothetical protein
MHKEAPVGLKQTIEAGSLRWKYPLRKTTLEKLGKIAQELTRPLNLAIQIILLDSGQSIKDGIDATKTLVTQVQATTLDTHFQVKDIAAGIQSILSAKDSEELAKILRWLSAPDPSANHAQAREQHEDGTGDWLFESQEYQDWVSGSSPLFWLHGKAGCCRTILCSTIIEDVRRRISGQDSVVLAYLYFSFSEERKQNYTELLFSMVTQLSRRRTVHPLLRDAYAQTQPSRPSVQVLEGILVALLEQANVVYLVVDALDECSENQRKQVIVGFKRVTQAVPKTRLLMTSRREADIEDHMASWCGTQLPINKAGVNRDIDMFVKNALATDKKLLRLSSATKKEIEDTFHEKADGMYVYFLVGTVVLAADNQVLKRALGFDGLQSSSTNFVT